ncbi:MAG: copper amine oxidase domain protein [Clostridiaceae bacterium]|nr:copper amine oxidase domain protein [Clostridiaceae bacterium]
MVTSTVFGSAIKETISVLYDKGVSVKVDGANLNLGDKAPIIYNGTTYLPVRAVAEAIGKPVNWDNDTRTVYLGTMDKLTKLTPEMIKGDCTTFTKQTDRLSIENYSVLEGIPFEWFDNSTDFIVNSKFTKMKFTVIVKNPDKRTGVYVKAGKEYKEELFKGTFDEGLNTATYEVDISNRDKVRVYFNTNILYGDEHPQIIIGDVTFQ